MKIRIVCITLNRAAVGKHVMINYITHNPSCTVKKESIHGFNQPVPAPRSQDPHGNGVRENNVVPLGQVHDAMSVFWFFGYLCVNSLCRNASCDF